MVDPKASRFWQVALQSGLIDEKGLQACFEAIVPAKRVAGHLDRRLARQAVQQGRLTVWQAQQILAGRSSGYKINRYTLIDMIGQGGMGRVYLAMDTRLNRRVALKILSPERMNNPRAIARFQREARVGAQLQHENLVRIYDEGEANGKCYLVMEYIEGKNLGAIIAEDGQVPPATAAQLARQVALGLEHAQKKGLIHRDVNPYNILITRDGVAKLTDLGLAIDQSEEAQVTREGATVGTFDYISPEQARHSHSVDTRSDIYSLGCTMYHMLAGNVPFPSPSLPEKLFAHQGIEPTSLTDLVPGIPEGLVAVVRKMMRKSPDDRYATPLEVSIALEPFMEGPGAAPMPGLGMAPEARGRGRSSMTETQVVATPRLAAGPDVAATVEAGSVAESSSGSSSSASTPSPVPAPAAGAPVSRSDEDWTGLGLGIDLGPEPSLTEGLSLSRKKKPRSSPEIAGDAPPAATAPAGAGGAIDVPSSRASAGTSDPVAAGEGLAGLGLGLALDLDPAAPLSSGARSRAGAATPSEAATGSSPASLAPWRRLGRRWMIAAGALGAVAVLAGLGFGFGLLGQGGSDGKAQRTSSRSILAAGSKAADGRRSPDGKGTSEVPGGPPFAVKTSDGTMVVEPSLKSAMQRAIGSKGSVLLSNRAPLKLSGPDAAINISGGPLYIRAAEGVRPVLEVEIKGPKPAPFLTTRTNTPLTIVGVSIVARYGGKPKAVPPLIEAGGMARIERCAFTASGAVKGTRAVAAEGGGLTVDGCWFEGFDVAIDAASFAGSSLTIRQSMMVRAATDDAPTGWAVRVRRAAGKIGKGARRLLMEHCTVKGAGLLELVDFSPESPFQVDLNECAVLADAMLAWLPGEPGTPLTPDALDWKGQGNLYDIRGKSWVVLSPEGTPELPDGPSDLASWRSNMRELSALRPPIRFRTAPESLSESPTPRDFQVIGLDTQAPGADPDHVGPSAPPEKH